MPFCPTCNGRFQEGTFCPKDGTQLLPDGEQPESLVGQVIAGRYRLTKLLGQGGMGEVYAAEHVHITKRVAVKVLHPEISHNPEALARFKQEAQSASSIGHDNIVLIDDFGQMDDGRFYLCMEFLGGSSLAEEMAAAGGMDPIRSLKLMVQVCDGLAAAHKKGIIHRDMKPENVFITKRSDGTELVKILDFGIAKVSGTDENQGLTKTGTVFGTPHYMSPEQALGQKLDHRADIYSMGVMLFEIFTGQVPFKAESFMGILSQHITKPPPAPSTMTPGRTIPKPIEDIILKAMAKEPDQRHGTMLELRNELEQVLKSIGGASADAVAATMALGSGMAQTPTPAPVAPAGASGEVPVARTAGPGTGPGPGAVGPGPGATGPGLQATVGDISGRMAAAPLPGQLPPGPEVGTQPTVAAMDTGQGPAFTPPTGPGPAQQQPTPATPAFQTGPGPAASPTPIPKTMMATSAQAAEAASAAVSPGPAQTAVPVVPSNYGTGTSAPPAKKSNMGMIIGIIAAVVVVLGGGGATAAYLLYFAKNGDDGPTPIAQNDPQKDPQADPKAGTADTPKPEPADKADAGGGTAVATKDTPDTTEAKAITDTDRPDPIAEKPEPRPRPVDKPKPIDKPKPPPKTHFQVKLITVPANARVRLNGRKTLGRTPVTIKIKRGQTMRLLLAHGRCADRWVTITGNADVTKRIKLTKKRWGAPDGIPGANPGGIPGANPFR